MSTTHDPKEEASQAESSAFGARAILLTLLIVLIVGGTFIGVAVYAGLASR